MFFGNVSPLGRALEQARESGARHVVLDLSRITRADLSGEAIRLGRLLVELLPEPEAMGLLALMLLHEARHASRTTPSGEMILLEDQDRSLWNRAQIEEGVELVESALSSHRFGPYTLQAAIAAVHADASTAAATDWAQIVQLYDQLLVRMPTPIVAPNRAIAVAELDGAAPALAIVEKLDLDNYYLYHAARADLLQRLGRLDDAALAYDMAIAQTANAVERDHLQRRRAEVVGKVVGS